MACQIATAKKKVLSAWFLLEVNKISLINELHMPCILAQGGDKQQAGILCADA
jgi:hypothetical protein